MFFFVKVKAPVQIQSMVAVFVRLQCPIFDMEDDRRLLWFRLRAPTSKTRTLRAQKDEDKLQQAIEHGKRVGVDALLMCAAEAAQARFQ